MSKSRNRSKSKSRKQQDGRDKPQAPRAEAASRTSEPKKKEAAPEKVASEQLSLAEMEGDLPEDRGNGAHPEAAAAPAESAPEATAAKGGKAAAPPEAESPPEPSAEAAPAAEGEGGEAPAEAAGPAIVELINSAEGCYQKLETGETAELSDAEWRKALARMLERKPAAG